MITIDGRADLLSMNLTELGEFLAELGVEKYRAKQIYGWMVRGVGFDGMTNLPKALRERLAESAVVNLPTIERRLVSKLDGTVKYLFGLYDGNLIESVFMRYKHGNTLCISSEVGCPMGAASARRHLADLSDGCCRPSCSVRSSPPSATPASGYRTSS